MKNKVLKVFAILIISVLVSFCLIHNTYADAPICKISFGTIKPNNPTPGQELTIEPKLTEINQAVAAVQFLIKYDSELFEVVTEKAADDWILDKQGTTYFATTKTGEATDKIGTIATIKLKVKDNAPKTKTTITITSIIVTGDDAEPVEFPDTDPVEITISSKEDQTENHSTDTNKETTNVDNNVNNNPSNTQQTEKPTTSTEVDNNKIVVVNGDTTSTVSSNKADSSSSTKNLPKTGSTRMLHMVIVVAVAITSISFISYRKYKNIK